MYFPEKIMHFSGIVSDSRQISSFSKRFGEIPIKFRQNFIKICLQNRKILSKMLKFEYFLIHFRKKFDEF